VRRIKNPNIEGETILALFSEEVLKGGISMHLHNAFYLTFSESRWLRFRIYCRGLHWKFVDSLEHPKQEGWDVAPYDYFYENFDLIGKRICRLELEETKEDIWLYRRKFRSEVKLRIILTDGFAIVFHYTDDLEHFIQRA
jgi:hypothetical protein